VFRPADRCFALRTAHLLMVPVDHKLVETVGALDLRLL
jgi:hypothetical protein